MMKFTTFLSCMLYAATAVVAAPATIERRTSYSGGTISNDVVNKGMKDDEASSDGELLTLCTPLTFIFARGSTERGVGNNIVRERYRSS